MLGSFLHCIRRALTFFRKLSPGFFFSGSLLCVPRIAFILRRLYRSLLFCFVYFIHFFFFFFLLSPIFFLFFLFFCFQNSSNASSGDFECFLKEFQLVSELDQIFCLYVCDSTKRTMRTLIPQFILINSFEKD